MAGKLTHIGGSGEASMVDIGGKPATRRVAIAAGQIRMKAETLQMIIEGNAKKGDVLGTARIAGIMAAKKTSDLIPLCHPLALSKVEIDISADHTLPGLQIRSMAATDGQTGVEMEALTACSLACLTIYDMAKAVDRNMEIISIRLIEKSGGKSGHFVASK
jgi:cyclic pyranopterin monophosphate synthase